MHPVERAGQREAKVSIDWAAIGSDEAITMPGAQRAEGWDGVGQGRGGGVGFSGRVESSSRERRGWVG